MPPDEHIIVHYQKVIKKTRNDEAKLLHCIGKLFDFPITIEHLQRTGVGKTVNSLRKYNGEVGNAAKNLIAKWKAMVATGEVGDKCEKINVMGDINNGLAHTKSPNRKRESNFIDSNSPINNQDGLYNDDKTISITPHSSIMLNKHNHRLKKCNKESRQEKRKKSFQYESEFHIADESRKMKEGSDILLTSKKAKILVDEGIDSSMGASFSDALGMCNVGKKKKCKKLQKHSLGSNTFGQACDMKAISNDSNKIPEALKALPQSKLDISLNLPLSTSILKITENYKPSPINQNVMNCIYPSTHIERTSLTNGDSLSIGISSKTMRTKVYSGVKTGAILIVPTLFDICIRVLQKNVDALEYTGGVPFDVLRPVLERTTPQQLLSFENYNSYLLEDTDVLWEFHVKRHFRGVKKQDGETWREMFLRCEDEKEQRLNILTKNIKISQKQSALPVRKTRLAYVDNMVKPPRSIQRKQEQFGTNSKLTASPAARVAALSSMSHNAVRAGDPRLKISRDLVQPSGNNQIRTKKAPLMAKTLQFIKKRYKK